MAFTDTFEGAGATTNLQDWTPTGGTAWTKLSGIDNAALVDTSGNLESNPFGNEAAHICDDQGSANQYVEVVREANESISFICCRLVDVNNFIGMRFTSSITQVFKRVAGSFTQIGSNGSSSANQDTLRLECDGNDIEMFIGGASEITGTATDHNTETSMGVVTRSQSGDWLESFEAGALGGGGGATIPVLYRHRRVMQSLLAR